MREYERDMAESQKNFQTRKYLKEPPGWNRDTYISLEKIGISPFIRTQLERSNTKISDQGCGPVSWCTNQEGNSERRTCALDVTFKIKNGK